MSHKNCREAKNVGVVSTCFYNSGIDKKTFQGLLVRGNQKKSVKYVSDPIVVKTRTFKSAIKHNVVTNTAKCQKDNNVVQCDSSETNTLGKCNQAVHCIGENTEQIAPKVTVMKSDTVGNNILGKCSNSKF